MDKDVTASTADSGSLYARHEKIHAREVKGRFATLRRLAAVVLLGIYYFLPWLTWDDRQAILFDLPARRFYIFGITLFPQDFIYLSWLLIMAALLLFLTTAVAGRLWCGYACPQTVWTEMFVAIERFVEGPHQRRRKLDKGAWTREKIMRKGAKNLLWLVAALWTGFTFVGYFTPIRDLGMRLFSFGLGPWETFWILFYSFATFGNAAKMREQVCKYMCPYARFQSAMFDRDTLIISYDEQRGEPRGGRKRGADPRAAGLGDCIDCNICVQVCPTGIDIRKGLQYECIACAACIDACDDVMGRMNYEPGLIKYTTQHAMEGEKSRVFRVRTLIYSLGLLALFVAFVVSLANRDLLRVDVIRDRNTLYRELPDGSIENVYTLKILNKGEQTRTFTVSVSGLPDPVIETDAAYLTIPGASTASVSTRVRAAAGALSGARDIEFVVTAIDDPQLTADHESRFLAPVGPVDGR